MVILIRCFNRLNGAPTLQSIRCVCVCRPSAAAPFTLKQSLFSIYLNSLFHFSILPTSDHSMSYFFTQFLPSPSLTTFTHTHICTGSSKRAHTEKKPKLISLRLT